MKEAAIVGRGDPKTEYWWPGLINGGKVLWITRDYKQSGVIWDHILRPMFKKESHLFRWREVDKIIEFKPNNGLFQLGTAENVDSHRGFAFNQVLCDEAAFWDLTYAMLQVIVPTFVDFGGAALVASTPKMGSGFNQLCEDIIDGERKNWEYHHGTAFDNPHLDKNRIQDMIDEYPEASPELDQEVYAKLLVEGGLAFREFKRNIHCPADFEPPDWWECVAGLDWGFVKNGWFGKAHIGDENECHWSWEYYFKRQHPYDVGYTIGTHLLHSKKIPRVIWVDAQMGENKGGRTILEEFEKGMQDSMGGLCPAIDKAPKGPGSRHTKKMMMHAALAWKPDPKNPDGYPPPWLAPRMTVNPDGCPNLARTLPKLRLDEDKPEDINTHDEDHPYDGACNVLLVHQPRPQRIEDHGEDSRRHPGIEGGTWRRKKRVVTLNPEEYDEGVFPQRESMSSILHGEEY